MASPYLRPYDRSGVMTAIGNLPALTPAEEQGLRCVAGFMVPASAEYDVPGADDDAIFADLVRSLGGDQEDVRTALATLREIAGIDLAPFDPAACRCSTRPAAVRRWDKDGGEGGIRTLGPP